MNTFTKALPAVVALVVWISALGCADEAPLFFDDFENGQTLEWNNPPHTNEWRLTWFQSVTGRDGLGMRLDSNASRSALLMVDAHDSNVYNGNELPLPPTRTPLLQGVRQYTIDADIKLLNGEQGYAGLIVQMGFPKTRVSWGKNSPDAKASWYRQFPNDDAWIMRYNGVGFIVGDPSETSLDNNVHIVKRNKMGGIDKVARGGKPLGSASFAIAKNTWYHLTLLVDHDQARYVGYIDGVQVLDVVDAEPGGEWPSYTNQYHAGILTWMENKGMPDDPNDQRWGDFFSVGKGHDSVFDNYRIQPGLVAPGDINFPPTVDAGPGITVAHAVQDVPLDATIRDDGRPDGALTSIWTQESGPASATIRSPATADTTVTLPEPGVYVFRLTVNDGELSGFGEVTVTRNPDMGDLVYAVNCGGGVHITSDGTPYQADTYHQTGNTYSTGSAIAGTEDDALFQSERYIAAPGTVDYAFPVTDGTYLVSLLWSENTGNGRLMDVFAEGQLMIDALDVVAAAGGTTTAYEQQFTVAVNDGTLDLSVGKDAAASENFPNIMAIRIHAADGGAGTRRIAVTTVDGFIWDCMPAGTLVGNGDTTIIGDLDPAVDHVLTPAPVSAN